MAEQGPTRKDWGIATIDQVLSWLRTRKDGLSEADVLARREVVGLNALPETLRNPWWLIFLRQFTSPLLWVLIIADGIAFLLGEWVDAIIIAVVLLLNGIIATFQEGRAEATLQSLREIDQTIARVMRDNRLQQILAEELVPGDIILLRPGDRVPADARLVYTEGLRLTEAALTGESLPVVKKSTMQDGGPLSTLVFRGTFVVEGSAEAVVFATGGDTMIGGIAAQIADQQVEIPLQKNIRQLTNKVVLGCIAVVILVFGLGLLLGYSFSEMMLVGVSLLVSIIPEGLPVVMTLVLAVGVRRMAEQQVLVKRLSVVDALGHVNILAVDKTGTITKNELSITAAHVNGQDYHIGGVGYSKIGDITLDKETIVLRDHPDLRYAAQLSNLSANATISREAEGKVVIDGDPTEAAFLVFGEKFGFDQIVQRERYPMLDELPFDFHTKYYANTHQMQDDRVMVVTGAPESVLPLCTSVWSEGGEQPLDESDFNRLRGVARKYSEQGLRVLILAIRRGARTQLEREHVAELSLVAILGMQDALRSEVVDAVTAAEDAGMRVVMITGDHPTTAKALAMHAGICTVDEQVLTGADIEKLDADALHTELRRTCAFARVTPADKLRIVAAYRDGGYVVAMTGDGVNDGPSLAAAHVGVAMGRTGTEVAKEAADVILLNDDFSMIPRAAAEGRHIYSAIQKVILFLFSTNLAELFVIVVAILLIIPLPLSSAQIVWLNLVTDSVLVLALALERRRYQAITRAWGEQMQSLVSWLSRWRMLAMVLVMTVITLGMYLWVPTSSQEQAMTLALTTLIILQIYNAWNVRAGDRSIFVSDIDQAGWLVIASVGVIALQVMAVSWGPLQSILGTATLSWGHWGIMIALGSIVVLVDEIVKRFVKQKPSE